MRVLLLAQKLPLPKEDGYNLRLHHLVPRLAERHAVHLLALDSGRMCPALEQSFASVRVVVDRERPPAPALGSLARSWSGRGLMDVDPAVGAAIRERLAAEAFDAVWVSGWRLAPHAAALDAPPVLGDVIDEGSAEDWADLLRCRRLWLLPGLLRRWWRTRAFERRYFRRFAACSVVGERDAAALRRLLPGLEVTVVPNGVDARHFAPGPEDRRRGAPTLVFEGAMSFAPNREAALFLARRVMPRLRRAVPGAQLLLVGRDPDEAVRALAGPDVEVTGFVEDVRPWLDRAWVFVSPLLGGTGIKNKVLQAWAMAKPVVATPAGLAGLAVEPGRNAVVAEGAKGLASACARLLGDPPARKRIGAEGRRTVLERYSWDASARELESILQRIAKGKRG